MTLRTRLEVIFGLLMLFVGMCHAQFTSNVQGIVQDPSGAVVPKATVTISNNGTGETRTATSDENGDFRFLSLAPGAYTVKVEASGYAVSRTAVTLLTEQNLNVPVTLKVGAVSRSRHRYDGQSAG